MLTDFVDGLFVLDVGVDFPYILRSKNRAELTHNVFASDTNLLKAKSMPVFELAYQVSQLLDIRTLISERQVHVVSPSSEIEQNAYLQR